MSDPMKLGIVLSQPAKIEGVIRPIGWKGEVDYDLADQLVEAKALDLEASEPVISLVEPVTDPRDELIEGLKADIEVLKAEVEDVKGAHAAALDQVDTRTTERDNAMKRVAQVEGELDQALARNAELAKELAPLLLAQAAAEPAPAPTKRAKAST